MNSDVKLSVVCRRKLLAFDQRKFEKFEMFTTLVRSCRSAAVISSFKDPPHLLQKAVQSFRAALATGLWCCCLVP